MLFLQAAFGRNLLSLSSFFTYVGLGLGFLGSSLALPFGVFVLICQRNPEKNLQVCPTLHLLFAMYLVLHASQHPSAWSWVSVWCKRAAVHCTQRKLDHIDWHAVEVEDCQARMCFSNW